MYPEIIQVTESCGYLGGINRVYFIFTTIGRIVSNNTDYIIVGEKLGSKAKKAKDLGIRILNEEDFLKKIND